MSWLDRTRRAVSDLVSGRRFERDIDQELQTFLDLDARERERAGATPAEANRAARASFGSIDACKEALRDMQVGTLLDSIVQDGRLALRLLRRHPSLAVAAILTIALGTLPLAATAGLANVLFFRPAPGVTGADRLVQVEFITRDETGDTEHADFSLAEHAALTARVKRLSGLAGRTEGSGSISPSGVDALYVDFEFVTHDYFQVLGIRMAAGRPFAPEGDREPGAPVVILGHGLARAFFGDPARSPGRAVLVNGLPFTVIGVVPPGFRGLKNDHFAQMWLPGASYATAQHVSRDGWRRDGADRIFEEFVGRLADNVDLGQARAELAAGARLLTDPEGTERFRSLVVRVQHQPGMSFSGANTRNEIAAMIALFTGAGVMLLLLAGANVGNLLLFQGARRRDELAMRAVLGASRWRLLRAHLIDVSLLSLLGGAVGLGLTWTVSRFLDGLIVPEAGFLNLPIDWRVGGVVLAGAMGVGIVFGGAPVVVASSPGSLALAARSGHHRGRLLRSALTVLQLALSLSLLVGAALLLATIRNLATVDIGFDPARVVSASLLPGENGYDDARALAFYRDLLDRAAASPAVVSVSVSGGAPIVGSNLRERVYLPGRDPARAIAVRMNSVTPDYFRVLGVPVVHGRAFTDQEVFARSDDTCGPVIISETLAHSLFGTRDVVGRVLVLPRTRAPMQCHVIGVAGDVRTSPSADWEATLYRPLGQSPLLRRANVLARSNGPTPLAIGALREAAAAIDSAIPLHLPRSLADAIEFGLAGQRIVSSVLASLAALGLLMAAVGLYGLVAETVVARTREFAIRMIVGAEPRSILVTVMRRAMRLAAIGTAAGIGLSAILSHALRSQLFGVTTLEPWVYASAAGVLAATVLLASLAPAVRAVRVNPTDALRAE